MDSISPSGEFSVVYAKNHNTLGVPLSPTAGVYPVYVTPFGKMASSIYPDNNYTWGIICLVIACALAVENLTLPSESLMFQTGDKNMPWFSVIVLAIVGIVLIANPNQKGENNMSEQTSQPAPMKDPEKAALNKRLETAFWGLFLILLGGQFLMPKSAIPNGVWSIGVGLILLGLNVARYFSHIRMSGFTTFLGILSLVGGLTELIFKLDFGGAFLLIILGAYLILKPWFDERKLFGKAEES